MVDYIKWIRSKVGHDPIILNFAGGCVVNDQGEILLQKRADKGVWGFPGGALELGESVEEAVKREVQEETGLKVELTKLIGIYSKYFDEYPNGDQAQTIAYFFELKVLGGELSAHDKETIELQFFRPDDMPELVNQQHRDALLDYIEGKRGVVR
ncbi:NUDIX hydrolase [Halobacillus litoralis]|uniref:NUDIX hydrolase n=1 Tax=Halobacillus litoralis TaxID=45668 RepID=UPI001CD1A3BE|nr:NUDIX hydrolase [Halobacillus litoralis]MCA0972095.1 NUDIX hydrolase [Halobacillus litoralis]